VPQRIAIRFCPPTPPWGSQRTFAEEYLPLLLQELPGSLVYSSFPVVPTDGSIRVSARNPLYVRGLVRRMAAIIHYQATFERQLASAGAKVLFCPFHNDGLAFPRQVKQILVVHDVVPLVFPGEYRMSRLLWATLFRAAIIHSAHIICVSEATKAELVRRLNLRPDRVSVVQNGYGAHGHQVGPARLPRILYVASTHSAHKNIPTLLEAFAACSLRTTHDLRIVGVPHRRTTPEIKARIRRLGIADRVQLLAQLDSAALRNEYQSASLFVYPSLCEGFGLPLLEAMAYGLPVCAARVTSIPEVAADAALYFDPRNPVEIARTMEQLHSDPLLQRKLVALGYANVSRFSWKRSAAETAAICREALAADFIDGRVPHC